MNSVRDFLLHIGKGEWEAGISAGNGGNIAYLKCRGRNILRPLLSEEELKKDPFRHGSPILLPANRTRGSRFSFRGKEYVLPSFMHGLVSSCPFRVLEHEGERVTLLFDADESVYPFPFRLEVEYRVDEDGMRAGYRLINRGETDMPFTFGLHTTFADADTFSVPVSMRMETDEGKIPTGKFLPLKGNELLYNGGCVNRGTFSGFYSSCGRRAVVNGTVALEVSQDFDFWTLFAPGEPGVICIEPQCGSADGLNLGGEFCRILKGGESILFQTHIFEI